MLNQFTSTKNGIRYFHTTGVVGEVSYAAWSRVSADDSLAVFHRAARKAGN